ncbi:MAG TPA: adenylyltransferase/cytidyltransferase family protein [Methanomicrobiales archaeon]|nr:adenylyltransferase/cytidyltransferase family protein [Methanomicrobiales archaeon]
MRRVVATGTFDIIHPGHIYYLEESRRLGDELHVIVARDRNVRHKPRPVIGEAQRLRVVQSLRVVDFARLGDQTDMFRPIEEIDPAVITLGFNQHFSEAELAEALKERGIGAKIVRVGEYSGDPCASTRKIIERILRVRGKQGDPDRGS